MQKWTAATSSPARKPPCSFDCNGRISLFGQTKSLDGGDHGTPVAGLVTLTKNFTQPLSLTSCITAPTRPPSFCKPPPHQFIKINHKTVLDDATSDLNPMAAYNDYADLRGAGTADKRVVDTKYKYNKYRANKYLEPYPTESRDVEMSKRDFFFKYRKGRVCRGGEHHRGRCPYKREKRYKKMIKSTREGANARHYAAEGSEECGDVEDPRDKCFARNDGLSVFVPYAMPFCEDWAEYEAEMSDLTRRDQQAYRIRGLSEEDDGKDWGEWEDICSMEVWDWDVVSLVRYEESDDDVLSFES
ncbi:hypothetical protein BT63DRAFT_423793 [Microthyrium microscopicum]|uniref:Uncharacterized protein n=1 Tax=Microthyrium microscopicum TaxID=703497 RepID=A0A6A6UCD1_9PEZI|nr:hypothetical protein BT63DRAFT_423793 [Microthyrium microscopicum]